MAYFDDLRVLVKIAHMYYEDGATQAEIAVTLGVSRPLISKYLAKARDMGIVQISIRDDIAHPYASVESALERKYHLREAIVVSEGGQSAKKAMGVAAANYLLRIVKKKQVVGVSSGTTLYEVANEIPRTHLSPLTVIPLVGGIGDERLDTHANQIVATMADRLGADYKLLHAPVVVDTPEERELFMKESSIADVFRLAGRADIAVVGIGGSPEHSTLVKSYMAKNYDSELTDADIVGDICYSFINFRGEASAVSWNKRVISLSLESLKKIPTVIGVAHGDDKVHAILAALRGSLINVLVTDLSTAKHLIAQ